MRTATIVLAACVAPLWAQEFKLPANLDKLSAKAENTVEVTLDGSMLRLASRFLSDQDHDQAKAKKLMAGIVVIAAEPGQLTVVNITGTLDPAKIVDLSGRFHIPELALFTQYVERTESK
jgi:hypothetical protein